jgi:hypothetical protein
MKRFRIKVLWKLAHVTHTMWVHSMNQEHMVVTMTQDEAHAKTWGTQHQATKWYNEHVDCGFGLNRSSAIIEEVT